MSNNCECNVPVVNVAVEGLKFALNANDLQGLGGPGGAGIDYSLEEQWTGRHWIDGKKIYQKTVDCGGMKSSAMVIPHLLENVDLVIAKSAFAFGTERRFFFIPNATNIASANIAITVTPDEIEVFPYMNRTALTQCYVTIQYTCTDR